MNIEDIAKICHDANKSLCETLGDISQLYWEQAPEWQKSSAINGVTMHLNNPNAGTQDSHNSWMKQKIEGGWIYGEIKDEIKKTHPCMVEYNKLPIEQQLKDYLFRGIVHAVVNSGIEIK